MNNIENTSSKDEVRDLMNKPVWQMSGEEFCILTKYATSSPALLPASPSGKTRVIGIKELAAHLGCCESTIYAIKKLGILDPAIVSQIGKRIVFDAERARELADEYQKAQREQRLPSNQ